LNALSPVTFAPPPARRVAVGKLRLAVWKDQAGPPEHEAVDNLTAAFGRAALYAHQRTAVRLEIQVVHEDGDFTEVAVWDPTGVYF